MEKQKTFKPSYKLKLENSGDYFNKVSRGVGVIEDKKKRVVRKEKHKKKIRDYL